MNKIRVTTYFLAVCLCLLLSACGKEENSIEESQDIMIESESEDVTEETVDDADKLTMDYVETGHLDGDQTEINVLERFKSIPWDEIEARNLKFTGEFSNHSEILCIGEIPEYQIKLYGYGDEEIYGNGVAIQIEDDVNYFDWNYISPRSLPPSVYWNDTEKQLQVALKIYTGTGAAAEELHVLQQYETGHLEDYVFELNDYSTILEERIGYKYIESEQKLQLLDLQENTVLTEIENMNAPAGIESLELGMISTFILGDEIILQVSPGYYQHGMPIAEYENMPMINIAVIVEYDKNDMIEFNLGTPEIVS